MIRALTATPVARLLIALLSSILHRPMGAVRATAYTAWRLAEHATVAYTARRAYRARGALRPYTDAPARTVRPGRPAVSEAIHRTILLDSALFVARYEPVKRT